MCEETKPKHDTIDRSKMLVHTQYKNNAGALLSWHLQCIMNSQDVKKHSAVHRRWRIWILQATEATMAKKTPPAIQRSGRNMWWCILLETVAHTYNPSVGFLCDAILRSCDEKKWRWRDAFYCIR
eukprot:375937_1